MAKTDRPSECIRLTGAHQHNLKNINVVIPTNRLTVVTGVSGSGKSSLVFDTLYAEGQRRYVESLSAYARQFLERLNKPRVTEITGISPAIAIRQRNTSRNPRSTVGTVTEIHDYLRLLYSRLGTILCRQCGRPVKSDTIDSAVQQISALAPSTRIYISFPIAGSSLDPGPDGRAAEKALQTILENLVKLGYRRLLQREAPGAPLTVLQIPEHCFDSLHQLTQCEILVDRLTIRPDGEERLTDSLELCYREGNGVAQVHVLGSQEGEDALLRFTERFECQHCDIVYRNPDPRLFSFNNPYGACPTCQGFGNTITLDPDLVIPDPSLTIQQGPIDPFNKPRYRRFKKKLEDFAGTEAIAINVPFSDLPEATRDSIWNGSGKFPGVKGFFKRLEKKKYKMHVRIFISRYRGYTLCPDCGGDRLCQEARDVYLGGQRISQLTRLPISRLQNFFKNLKLSPTEAHIGEKILTEIARRLRFLTEVGLDYLTLDRLTSSLSGGEMQRIHLAASLSSSLVGTLYVLDEPSIGLHSRDGVRLIQILKELRDLGNTVVVVEHERGMIEAADHVIDMGPGAGERGGEVIHSGDLASLRDNPASQTGQYLSGQKEIPVPVFRRPGNGQFLEIRGAREHNLKNIDVRIPLGLLACVTGVSGSGKSTLIHDILYAGIKKEKGEWKAPLGDVDQLEGSELLSEVLLVDQTPIGRTPRSNPVTYIKAFDEIRKTFAATREAQSRGLSAGSFSFNIAGGRCPTCDGAGVVTVEMQFLADVELTCEDCKGTRYSNRVLQVSYRKKNIAEVLQMTVNEALGFFRNRPPLLRKLRVLAEVGLGYLRLGQSATTLSGGEAQRIKLASYLSKRTSKNPLFIFDEPTTGLHFDDIKKLLFALDRLIAQGASIVIIEHNLDVIKCADWIIDLGPEGGSRGGRVVAEGQPETIAAADSHTGKFLKKCLQLTTDN